MAFKALRGTLLCGATAVSVLTFAPAYAQGAAEIEQQRGGIADIVVTARRREENLQDTPIAVTAVNSEIIESRGIQNFVDLAKITPNVKIHDTPGGLGAAAIYMRGIGYGDNIIGNDAPFGFYIDGVPFGRISTSAMDIVEPDSLQVLRGPQGTLFGRNTTGGAIVVQTHTPSDEFSGVVKGSYGSFDAVKYSARVDTGLIAGGNVKASFAYQHRQRDGIVNNLTQPDHLDPGADDADMYWGKIMGEWGDLKVQVSADYTRMGGVPVPIQAVDAIQIVRDYFANSVANGGNTIPITGDPLFEYANYATPLPQRIVQKGVQGTIEYALNDHLTAKVIAASRAYRRDDTNNYGPSNLRGPVSQGAGNPPVLRSFSGWYGFLQRYQTQSQKTAEVQLQGQYDQVNFTLGGFYFDESAHDFGTTRLPFFISATLASDVTTFRDYSVKSKSKAAFAQVDYRPEFADNKLELTGGIRYTDDSRDFNQITPVVRSLPLKGDNWSYMVGANYKFTDAIMAYAKYSTGYRAGGFNARSTGAVSPVYDPEKIKSMEAGIKFEGFDRRLRINAAAFFNKYHDLQVTQFASPTGASTGGNINVNADAEYKGFEIEATVAPVDGLTISGSYGYVDAKYKSYPRALLTGGALYPGCTPITNGSGTTVLQQCADIMLFQNTPDEKWDASATYEFPAQDYGTVSVSVDYSWTGKTPGVFSRVGTNFPYSLDNKSYGLLGARISLADIPVNDNVKGTLALYGRNLTDKRYSTASIDFGQIGSQNFPERRTMGVEAKVQF